MEFYYQRTRHGVLLPTDETWSFTTVGQDMEFYYQRTRHGVLLPWDKTWSFTTDGQDIDFYYRGTGDTLFRKRSIFYTIEYGISKRKYDNLLFQ